MDAQPAPTLVRPAEPPVGPVETLAPAVEPVRPAMGPVQPVELEMPPGFTSSAPKACDNELTLVPDTKDDEQLVDYSSSLSA